jgi:hypothetical protein
MDRQMTDSDIVDLYEEMLCERAAKGLRPVLYVSSATDFECNLLMLLDEAREGRLAGQWHKSGYGALGQLGKR